MRRTRASGVWAGAVVMAVVGLGLVPGAARAQAPAHGRGVEQAAFDAAAARYGVPADVLLAVGYEESSWDEHPGTYNTSGGYGPMNLTDVTAGMLAGGGAGLAGRAGATADVPKQAAAHTLTSAARLVGASGAALRDDAGENILGGAALLASYEKALTGGTPTDPAAWYGAVARYSGSQDTATARAFADRVFDRLAAGTSRTTVEGQRVTLAAEPGLRPDTGQLAALGLKASAADSTPAQCPADLDCSFLPADPSNYQVADRPSDGMAVRYIVIHDTESSFQSAVDAFQTPGNGDSANYVMAADGSVTQMVPNEDLAFHAGNYWFNMHAIGIEHEGFAAHGASWYSQTVYQNTADLVRYLSAQYGIPLDRQHIIGHDNVPGPLDSYIPGMHWDPGPYWDWAEFMRLVGAPVDAVPHGVAPVGGAVTIDPSFATNEQTAQVCPVDDPTGATTTCTDQTEPASTLYVRTAPSPDAPLFSDPGLHTDGSAGTDRVSDWGDTVSAGQQFVVAGLSGDWTAIWYAGQKVWFYNPHGVNTSPATGVQLVGAAGSAAIPVYGEGYPQPSEYPTGLNPSTEAPLSVYAIPPGQAYVTTQPPVSTDDYFATSGTVVTGAGHMYTIQYDHRVVLVNASDVTVTPACAPTRHHS